MIEGWLSVKRTTGFVVLISILVLGCTPEDTPIDAAATDSVATMYNLETSPVEELQLPANTEDPFAAFGQANNDVAATTSETPVWLVNRTTQPVIITAQGGAERVLIDTIGAADSALVKINTRALTVEISARTSEGVTLGTVVLPMDSEPKRVAFPH